MANTIMTRVVQLDNGNWQVQIWMGDRSWIGHASFRTEEHAQGRADYIGMLHGVTVEEVEDNPRLLLGDIRILT